MTTSFVWIVVSDFTGSFARWGNAPPTALDWIGQSIVLNHQVSVSLCVSCGCLNNQVQGVKRGRWHLTIKNYRSTLGNVPGFQVLAERSLSALTMDGQ